MQHCLSRHWALLWRISLQLHIIVVTCHTVKRILPISLSCPSSSPPCSLLSISSLSSSYALFQLLLKFHTVSQPSNFLPQSISIRQERGLKFCLILDPNPQSCSTLCSIQNYSKKNVTVDDFLETLNSPSACFTKRWDVSYLLLEVIFSLCWTPSCQTSN